MNRIVLLLVVLLVPAFMVSNDSIWIDEATTAFFAAQPNIRSWYFAMMNATTSEVQMPLSMLLTFFWGHVVGSQEWQLRLPNLFYAWSAVWAMWLIGRRQNLPWLPLLFVSIPFLGFYINEARPYVLMIAAASWILYGVLAFVDSRGRDVGALVVLCTANIFLCSAHMLGLFLCGGVFITLLWQGWRERWGVGKKQWYVIVFSMILMLPIVFYYIWTVLRGAGGAKIWGVSAANLLFVLYEFLGLSALGPPRHILRETMSAHSGVVNILVTFLPYGLGLAIIVLLYCLFVVKIIRTSKFNFHVSAFVKRTDISQPQHCQSRFSVLVIMCLTVLLLLFAAYLAKWPFWGRHLASIFPFWVFTLADYGKNILWSPKTRLEGLSYSKPLEPKDVFIRSNLKNHVLCGLFSLSDNPNSQSRLNVLGLTLIIVFLIGSINQRYNPIYARDDYRSACQIAHLTLENDKIVWWAADLGTAKYYGLNPQPDSHLMSVSGLSRERIDKLAPPNMIILSKTDLFDSHRVLSTYLKDKKFERKIVLPAFTIWLAPSEV